MTSDRPHLRPVQDGEKAKPKAPKNITEALDGSSRDVLVAMRRALAKKLDTDQVSSNSIASAYKELRELDRLIRIEDAEGADEKPAANVSNGYDASAV